MKVVVKFKARSFGQNNESVTVQAMGPGDWTAVNLSVPGILHPVIGVSVELQAEEDEHRSLADILAEAVQHGKDNPTHGGNCACLDRLVREIKQQINAVLPGSDEEPDWERRTDARWRVTYLMNTASRYL